MRDIVVGLAIIFGIFLLVDFITTEKNSCVVTRDLGTQEYKCGILYKELDIKIDLFDRYW